MKKIVFITIVLFCMGLFQEMNAQNQKKDLRDIGSLSFYGVEFSYAKVFGAEETADQFLRAFMGINDLFFSEPVKYNASTAFGISNVEKFFGQVNQNVENISPNELFTSDHGYEVTDEEIARVVVGIDKQGDSQYGAIIIAGLINKASNYGKFTFVVFDQNTNEIIFQQTKAGKARGFGLRNFWATALRRAMKNVR